MSILKQTQGYILFLNGLAFVLLALAAISLSVLRNPFSSRKRVSPAVNSGFCNTTTSAPPSCGARTPRC